MGTFRYVGDAVLQQRAMAAIAAAVNQSANHLVAASAAAAPVDEGTLRASIHTDGAKISGLTATARVQTGGEANEYAIFVHEGTGPHKIVPRQAKALAFGGIVVKSVNHPGTAATKFMERPLLQHRSTYLAYLAAAARSNF